MSSEHFEDNQRPKVLDAMDQELMRCASSHRRTRLSRVGDLSRRRLAVPLAVALALPVGAGIAIAAGTFPGGDGGPEPVYQPLVEDSGPPMDAVVPGSTVGYLDLETGKLITCPDGEPLTRTYGERTPVCSDGSIPETYATQEAAWDEFLKVQASSATPEPPENGPNFQVVLKKQG